MAKLIVIGNAAVDIQVPAHAVPPAGQTSSIARLSMDLGGNATWTAAVAARLGVSTAFSGVLGHDVLGHLIRDQLSKEGVDVTRLQMLVGRDSPSRLVYLHGNGESVVQHAGTNADYNLPPIVLRAPCRVFHLATPELLAGIWPRNAIEIVRQLKVNKRTVSVDLYAEGDNRDAIQQNVKEHRHLLELIDICFTNEAQARSITGRAERESVVRYFHERGVSVVVVKRGRKGAIVSHKGRIEDIPPARVKEADSVGVGASFVAGFLAGYVRGQDPVRCGRLGGTIAAMSLQSKGGLAGTANPVRLKKILDQFEAANKPVSQP